MVNKAEANNCFSMHCNPKLSNYVVNSVNKENMCIFLFTIVVITHIKTGEEFIQLNQ